MKRQKKQHRDNYSAFPIIATNWNFYNRTSHNEASHNGTSHNVTSDSGTP